MFLPFPHEMMLVHARQVSFPLCTLAGAILPPPVGQLSSSSLGWFNMYFSTACHRPVRIHTHFLRSPCAPLLTAFNMPRFSLVRKYTALYCSRLCWTTSCLVRWPSHMALICSSICINRISYKMFPCTRTNPEISQSALAYLFS